MSTVHQAADLFVKQSGALIKFENVKQALAEIVEFDEVKSIRDKAVAMGVYAQQARDADLLARSIQYRRWAERRAGELLVMMKASGERDPGGHGPRVGSHVATQPPKLADLKITKTQSSRWQKLADLDEETFQAALANTIEKMVGALDGDTKVRGTQGTGENEWFTPAEYIQMAREVLGAIDLDPATHPQAQTIVRAAEYFTKDDDGLNHEWHGRVWLNPPYAQPLIANFVSKLCSERRAGRVTGAIMLTHNYTDTAWFHEAAGVADAICFTRGRIKFYEIEGTVAAPTQGQAFFYFGDEVEAFVSLFLPIGFVVRPCE